MITKFIHIIPVEDTYFAYVKKPNNVKLSKEAILANYSEISPFPNGDVIFLQEKDYIFLWFTKNKTFIENKILIPEGYLLYKALKQEKEAVGIYVKSNTINAITIIKNNILVSQTTVKPDRLNKTIDLLIKEYSLKNPEKKEIKKLPNVSLKDIFLFADLDIKNKNTYKWINDFVLLPLSIFFVIIAIFYFILDRYLEDQVEEKTVYLNELKKNIEDIKNMMFDVQEKKLFWENFIEKELKYPSLYLILNEIMKIIKNNNGYITHFEFSGNYINLWAGLNSKSSNIINQLIKTGLFKNVKIISTVKDRNKKGYQLLNIEMYLREKNE